MRVQDLIDAQHLGIRALYLPDDSAQREIAWTFTTDLPDPTRYLARGQLVLTGLVWRQNPSASEQFVSVVAESGAIALLAGEGLFGSVPDDVTEACTRHGLPLLAVPAGVSFASVTAFISSTLASKRLQSLTSRLVRQREMLMEVYRGQLLDDLINRTIADLGRQVWLISASGRHIVASSEPLDAADLTVVTAAVLGSVQSHAVVTGSRGQRLSVFVVSTLGEHRVRAWFLVVDGDQAEWEPALVESVHELVSIVGIYRVQRAGEVVGDVEMADRLIELLSTDSEQPEAAGYLRQAGIDPDAEMTVIAAGFRDVADSQDLAMALLADAVAHIARPIVARDAADGALAIVPAAELITRPSLIADALRRAAHGLPGVLAVGMSHPARVDTIGGAIRSARYGLHLRPSGGESVHVVDSTQIGSAVRLLAAVPDHLRRVYVENVLGPLIDHDERFQSQLMSTLRAFLDSGGSWVKTAEATHLHLNTVRYRIGRVEQLTGRDINDTAHRADLHLALNLL